jgi:hypothetical protein
MFSPLPPRLVELPSKMGESWGAEAYFGQSQYYEEISLGDFLLVLRRKRTGW